MLAKYQLYFSELELNSLLPQIPYIRNNYSSSNLEEIADRNLEIMKLKKEKLFAQFPTNTQQFKNEYENKEKAKIKFLYISLAPRKSDGKVDWIKWQEEVEKEEKLIKLAEIKNYLQNKTNPALKNWYDNLKTDPDPVKRLNLINQQIEEHLNIYKTAWQLYKVGKDKGWANEQKFKDSFNPIIKDAAGNRIKMNLPLVIEYDLSNWQTS
jgi:hypothetical protein